MALIDELMAQGVYFAPTKDSHQLPIIDLTHARFFLPDDPAAIAALQARVRHEEQSRRFFPRFLLRLMGRRMADRLDCFPVARQALNPLRALRGLRSKRRNPPFSANKCCCRRQLEKRNPADPVNRSLGQGS